MAAAKRSLPLEEPSTTAISRKSSRDALAEMHTPACRCPFQSGDAIITFQQFVGVHQLGCTAAQGIHPYSAVIFNFRVVQQHFPAHDGDIARGGKVAVFIQPAGIAERGALHTQLFGAGVHALHKIPARCHQ